MLPREFKYLQRDLAPMRTAWVLSALLLFAVLPGPSGAETTDPIPHVLVAVPDSGINPYHEMFHRPELTEHPCTYIEDFPCSVQKLELSIGDGLSYSQALDADDDAWDSVQANTWYWIPETPFVAVSCEPVSSVCILDDDATHGTGTTSSVVQENPDALIAFKEGGSTEDAFVEAGLPIDVFSVSWGSLAPIPLPRSPPTSGLYVTSSGNYPSSILMDGWDGHPRTIAVGGGYADGFFVPGSEEALATHQPDVVGPFCREVADVETITGTRSACGTSFSTPTVAGGLSKTILEIRQASGYTGGPTNGLMDPLLGVTEDDVREAMNWTATYHPNHRGEFGIGVPLTPGGEWLQWGWGWFDGVIAERAAEHLTGETLWSKPSEAARTYMYAIHDARELLYGTGDPEHAPEATIISKCEGLACTFDASQSTDPDGQPLSYAWDLGDGTTSTAAVVDHTYPIGSREVTLTVSDGQLTDTVTAEVFTMPEAALEVSTDAESYGLADQVTVTVVLTARGTGDPISGIPIELVAQYQAPGSNGLHQGRTYRAMDEADTGHHAATVITDEDGIASWTIPSDVAEQDEHLNLPTGTEEVAVTSTFDRGGVRLWDKTTYTVSPL